MLFRSWKMVVMGPADRKQYEWTDLKQLPVESTIGGPGSVTTPTTTTTLAPPRPHRGPEALENPDKPGVINAPAAPEDSSGKDSGNDKPTTGTDGK